MKDSHEDEKLLHQVTPASKGRRCFIGSIATLGAGLTGSVILPSAVVSPTAPQPLVSGVSCHQSSPNRGREFVTRCSMAGQGSQDLGHHDIVFGLAGHSCDDFAAGAPTD
jgi:hypothetical protein